MSFYVTDKAAAAKVETGGNYISKSGLYDVTIKSVIVDTNNKGSNTLSLYVNYNGQDQVLYSLIRLTNNDGTPSFQLPLFNDLCIISGVDSIGDPSEETLPIGKSGADKEVAVLEDLSDIEVKLWIQQEFKIYDGSMRESKNLLGIYTTDGTSADEILNESPSGVRLAKKAKYHEVISYKEGATPELVEEWVAAGYPKNSLGGSAVAAPKPSFGKPSFGKK